jgi:hypothetical protein
VDLTNALVNTLRAIPELVTELGGDPSVIVPYIDGNPAPNSLSQAIYQQALGSVLAAWQETILNEGEMEAWRHDYVIFLRAAKGHSPLTLGDILINGVPNPGDGLRWRYCPVMDGVLPATVTNLARPSDSEGIDYHSILVQFTETGDT